MSKQFEIVVIGDSGVYHAKKVEGTRIVIRGFENFTFFVHESYFTEGKWVVSEKLSGAKVTDYEDSKGKAIKKAIRKLKNAGMTRLKEVVKQYIKYKQQTKNR